MVVTRCPATAKSVADTKFVVNYWRLSDDIRLLFGGGESYGYRFPDILRAVPQMQATMPPNAIGRDFRSRPYAGWTDSGTGLEANLYGLLGVKAGWVEGLEINFLGLVAGLDIRDPALKLPAFGRIGLPSSPANAALAPSR